MELSEKMETFIASRIDVANNMVEGDEKEKTIKNIVELVKANTDATKTTYSNSFDMCKLSSDEALEREKMEQVKSLEEAKLENTKAIEQLRTEQAQAIELVRLENSKALENMRYEHECSLEEIRASFAKEQKRLERTGKVEKAINYSLRVLEIGVPVGLFVVATAIENENGYLNSMSKTVLTKLRIK